MRISDWSSDVCSSDLGADERLPDADRHGDAAPADGAALRQRARARRMVAEASQGRVGVLCGAPRRSLSRARAALSGRQGRSEEHTSELQSLMRISYAVFCLKKKTQLHHYLTPKQTTINTCYYLRY